MTEIDYGGVIIWCTLIISVAAYFIHKNHVKSKKGDKIN